MTSVAIGLIGCGYWGPNLLRNLVANHRCRLKWVADRDRARRDFVTERHPDLKTSAEAAVVLDDPVVDAVVIATPASTHVDLTLAALAAGKHVLVEKPLAMSVADVDRIAAAAGDRVVMVGHTFLYNGAVRYIKSVMERQELGDIYYVTSERRNLGQVRSDVNVWWNLAPHDVSILLYLFGHRVPNAVSAHGLIHLQAGVEDVVFANLTWPEGRGAHIHVSWLDPERSRRVALVGSRKMLLYDDAADYKVRILDKGVDVVPRIGERMDYDDAVAPRFVQRSGATVLPEIEMGEPLRVEIDHFIDCIVTGAPPLTGLDHARAVTCVLEQGAWSLASATGRAPRSVHA